jgi:hypothetical protein
MAFAWGLDKAGMTVEQPCPLAWVLRTGNLPRGVVDERIGTITNILLPSLTSPDSEARIGLILRCVRCS